MDRVLRGMGRRPGEMGGHIRVGGISAGETTAAPGEEVGSARAFSAGNEDAGQPTCEGGRRGVANNRYNESYKAYFTWLGRMWERSLRKVRRWLRHSV